MRTPTRPKPSFGFPTVEEAWTHAKAASVRGGGALIRIDHTRTIFTVNGVVYWAIMETS